MLLFCVYSCNSSVMYGHPGSGIWVSLSLDVVAAAFVTCILMKKKKTQSPTDKPSMMTSQAANNIYPKSRELHKTNLIIRSKFVPWYRIRFIIEILFVWLLLLLLQWVARCGLLLLWVTIPYNNNSISIRSKFGLFLKKQKNKIEINNKLVLQW